MLLLHCAPGGAESLHIARAARSIQPGELVVLTISNVPSGTEEVRVSAFGQSAGAFKVSSLEWRALVAIDLDVKPGKYPVSIETRPRSAAPTSYALRVRPRTFATRRLNVPQDFVTTPPEVQTRIEREAGDLQRLWTASAPQRLWNAPFLRPVAGRPNSSFGMRSIFNGEPRSPHGGADFSSATGTPVLSPNAGRVVLARDLYFSGNTVVVDHGLGLFSLLAHLSEMNVHEGDTVSSGDVVGRVGATGRVTGPHLHWAVRIGSARVDPLSLLALLGSAEK
jgi:murein DD-endopeptidase MepM/ murein hydrolase activator NlpD